MIGKKTCAGRQEVWNTPEMCIQCCCYCSVTQSRPTLCNPTDCRTQGFPVLRHLLELAQTHVHWIGDAIELVMPFNHLILCYPLSRPLPSPICASIWLLDATVESVGYQSLNGLEHLRSLCCSREPQSTRRLPFRLVLFFVSRGQLKVSSIFIFWIYNSYFHFERALPPVIHS